jgi:hypothetical protein
MSEAKHLVYLTDEELMFLDGKTERGEIVERIKALKAMRALVADGVPEWFAPVIRSAVQAHKLDIHSQQGYDCRKCGRKARCYPKYKVGPKAGQENHNKKPYDESRMVVAGLHYCSQCFLESVQPEIDRLIEAGEDRFEISLGGQVRSKVVREEKRICPKCKGECWDFDMGLKVTMMDSDGRYYGTCPYCGFESAFFGPGFKITRESRVVPVESLKVVKPGQYTYYQREKIAVSADK